MRINGYIYSGTGALMNIDEHIRRFFFSFPADEKETVVVVVKK